MGEHQGCREALHQAHSNIAGNERRVAISTVLFAPGPSGLHV